MGVRPRAGAVLEQQDDELEAAVADCPVKQGVALVLNIARIHVKSLDERPKTRFTSILDRLARRFEQLGIELRRCRWDGSVRGRRAQEAW